MQNMSAREDYWRENPMVRPIGATELSGEHLPFSLTVARDTYLIGMGTELESWLMFTNGHPCHGCFNCLLQRFNNAQLSGNLCLLHVSGW